MVTKTRLVGPFALLILLLVISGCGAQAAPATPAAPATKLRIGYNQWVGYGALFIANDKGFFKKSGIDVELVPYQSVDLASSDFARKKIDGNLTTLTDSVAQAAIGLPVQIIWVCD